MQSHFRVEISRQGATSIVTVGGELDLSTSGAFEEELARAPESDTEMLVVDLHELEFMDSTGLSTLVRAQQATQEAGRRFVLVRGPQQVQRLLMLTGVAERIEVVDSLDALPRD